MFRWESACVGDLPSRIYFLIRLGQISEGRGSDATLTDIKEIQVGAHCSLVGGSEGNLVARVGNVK